MTTQKETKAMCDYEGKATWHKVTDRGSGPFRYLLRCANDGDERSVGTLNATPKHPQRP